MAVDEKRSLRAMCEEIATALKPLTDEGVDVSQAAQIAMALWVYKEKGFPITAEGQAAAAEPGECNCEGCQARRAAGMSGGPSLPALQGMMETLRGRLQGGETPPNMMMVEVPNNMVDEKGAERFCEVFIPKFTPEALAVAAKRFKKACK